MTRSSAHHRFDFSALTPRDAYKVMIGTIVPRPIAWVTTVSPEGVVNAAPYSFFNCLSADPPILALGVENKPDRSFKDTAYNIRMTECFTVNIVDRAKDVIISGGENISSIEVEDVLYDHPAVLEAAVIGIPSEQWGETPLALIVPREGHDVTRDDIVAHCRATMAGFKIPRQVEFVETLPRTATGKLKKFELREAYWAGVEKRVN